MRGLEKLTRTIWVWKYDGVTVDVHVESDWAKLPERQTSGGMMVNGTVVKHSRTRASRALSTAETQYHAVVRRAAEGFSARNPTQPKRLRQGGLGETRHVELKYFLAGGGTIWKSKDEAGARRATFGGPFDEVKVVARN